jgi:hypothetical protein
MPINNILTRLHLAPQQRLDISGLAAAAFRAGMPLRYLFRRRARKRWDTLNPHLLADIGETPTSAQDASLGDVINTPLGAVGLADAHGRRVFHRVSRLG